MSASAYALPRLPQVTALKAKVVVKKSATEAKKPAAEKEKKPALEKVCRASVARYFNEAVSNNSTASAMRVSGCANHLQKWTCCVQKTAAPKAADKMAAAKVCTQLHLKLWRTLTFCPCS